MKTFDELPLVLQLQHLAQKQDSNIEELLRRAKLVAIKLKLTDFENWCEQELMGYKCDINELPNYRVTCGRLFVFNPYQGLVPFFLQDDEAFRMVTTIPLKEPVGEYINLLKKESDNLMIQMPKGVLDFLYRAQKNSYGYTLEPRLTLETTQIESVLTYVRNIIFNWSVDLEKSGILGEGMQFTKEEKEKAMSNTTYNIANMQGVAGHVQDSSVTQTNQMIVNQMDISTLLNTFKNVGVGESDLNELQQAINEDEKPIAKNSFGEKVSKWYGKMITKAADGSWEIGVAVAANLLTESLNSFYGLN
ncbi:MAG: hypothetical protein LBV35_16910 [Acinetobacter sp.]|uniref:AbiTii domain-containing protein n=1 Tax=Acinetobacter bereziniae TaxID=106648 RepID=UPI00283EF040|nr:hypothetical protein [Acinetobacter sp.]